MRRTYPILPIFTFAAALLACYAAWAQSPPRTSCPPADPPMRPVASQPTECRRPAQAAQSDNDKLVDGLVAILNETESSDTLLVTIKALADLGPRARLAVPAIIRAADRLGMLKGLAQQKGEDSEGMAVIEALEQILKGGSRPARCCAPCCSAFLPTASAPAPLAVPVQPTLPPVPAH
jgi:hypothetical protein